jgi:U3 small nucleolar RNA-associated protein 10
LKLTFQARQFSKSVSENIIHSNNVSANLEAVTTKLCDDNPHVRLLGHLIALALLNKSPRHLQVDIGEQILACMGVADLTGVDDLSQEHLALEV